MYGPWPSSEKSSAAPGDLVQEIKLPGQPFDDGAIFRSDSEVAVGIGERMMKALGLT